MKKDQIKSEDKLSFYAINEVKLKSLKGGNIATADGPRYVVVDKKKKT